MPKTEDVDRATLAIHAGDLASLDTLLWQAAYERRLAIDSRSAPTRAYRPEVLLVADGRVPAGKGKVYCIIGSLRGARPVGKGKRVKFDELERFPVPVVISRDDDEAARQDLVGDVSGWGPTGFYYLPYDAFERVLEEARAAARPKRREQPRPPEEATAMPTPAASAEVGMHRVHLVCMGGEGAGDYMTLYVPLDAEKRLLRTAARPWLVRAIFHGNNWHGELISDGGKWNRISWDIDGEPDSLIDLATVPVHLGGPVRLHLADSEESERRTYVVRAIQRV